MNDSLLLPIRRVAMFCLLYAAAPARAAFPALQWATTPVHPVTPASGFGWSFDGDVTTDAAGSVFATVMHGNMNAIPVTYLKHTMKKAADGTTLWNSPVGGFQITLDGAGNVVVLDSPVVHRLSPTGQLLWSQTLSFSPFQAVAAPDGSIYVCGSVPAPAPANTQIRLQKLTSAGAVEWTRSYTGSAPGASEATGLVVLPDNGVAVSGSSFESGNATSSWLVLRYSSAGVFQWIHTAEPGKVMSMAAAGSDVVCAGQREQSTSSPVVVKRLTTGGSLVWRTEYLHPLPAGESFDWLRIQGLAVDGSGALCVLYHRYSYNSEIRDTFDRVQALWLSAGGGNPQVHTVHSRVDQNIGQVFPAQVCARPEGGFFASVSKPDFPENATSKIRLHADGTFLDAAGTPPGAFFAKSCIASAAGASGYYELAWDVYSSVTSAGEIYLLRYADATAAPPLATTTAASALLRTSAVLNGTVNTQGQAGECWFEYGPTTAYGSATPHRTIPSGGTGAAAFTEPLAGLTPGATYHFRIAGSTAAGPAYGGDMTFTTPVSPWAEFVLQWFGSSGAPNSGLLDDPDHDGLANFIEHGLGTSPLTGNGVDSQPAFWTSPDSGISYLSIVYTPVAEDITYTPEASNTMAADSWVTTGFQIIDEPGGKKRAVARGFQRFLRLRLTYTP